MRTPSCRCSNPGRPAASRSGRAVPGARRVGEYSWRAAESAVFRATMQNGVDPKVNRAHVRLVLCGSTEVNWLFGSGQANARQATRGKAPAIVSLWCHRRWAPRPGRRAGSTGSTQQETLAGRRAGSNVSGEPPRGGRGRRRRVGLRRRRPSGPSSAGRPASSPTPLFPVPASSDQLSCVPAFRGNLVRGLRRGCRIRGGCPSYLGSWSLPSCMPVLRAARLRRWPRLCSRLCSPWP